MRTWTPTLVFLALIACGGSNSDGTTIGTATGTATGTGSGTGTGTGTGSITGGNGDLTVSCAVQSDNALRYDCAVTATTAGAIDVEWEALTDGTVRGFTTETTGTDHDVTIYAMKPEWSYEVRFTGADGTATVDITPAQIPISIGTTTTGTGSSPVLISTCASEDAVAIVDVDGQPLWYQTYGAGAGRDGGYHFTPDGTVLTGFDHAVTEHALDGTQLLRFERGVDFGDDPLHHDIHRGENGLIYALFAELDGNYVVDGVHIFDESGLIDSWHLADEITPNGSTGGGGGPGFWNDEFPGATDWSHGNSVHADAAGNLFMSFRWLSAGMKIDGEPSSPTFGQIQWALVGEAGKPVASDFSLSSSIGADSDFIGQHHFNPTPDGRMALFDNRELGGSRGVVIDVDETTWTADIQESWELSNVCMAQGATYVLPNGNALVTCATSSEVYEYEPGGTSPVWTLTQNCGGGFGMLPRGIPADL